MSTVRLALKVDVDTERGTREGVPALAELFARAGVPAAFYFSMGPDHTGRALTRVFRPGFVGKTVRTNVVAIYGIRTLLNGILLPGPMIARRHSGILRAVRKAGFEVGIHCWDHIRWQDKLHKMSAAETSLEFGRALSAFEEVFGTRAVTAAAAGWQANAHSLAAYDAAGLLYASDTRGRAPFYPRAGEHTFRTLQIPTTLPTLDELLGRPEYPEERLSESYLSRLVPDALNVLTLHAEIEGMYKRAWFTSFLGACRSRGVAFTALADEAQAILAHPDRIPVADLVLGSIPGRSGVLALQAEPSPGAA
ncbi:MAG TPA: polysaccharide deacetylase family protein [Myxococcota bacterium]|nr:polysaccharide deacetylase family protein [Myxococcota bacterium]